MELGDKIKNLRKKAGITQEKLAAELGVTPQTISKYERAIAYFEKAYELEKKPRYSDALYGIAMIWEILGDYEKADHACERILQNLAEEWQIMEGAPVAEVLNLQKSFRN